MHLTNSFSRAAALLSVLALAPATITARENLHGRQTAWKVGQKVDTTSGSVTGQAAQNASEVSEYLGIPYAQPPVGKLRFQPPGKVIKSAAVLNATKFGNSCIGAGPAIGSPPRDLHLPTPAGTELLRLIGDYQVPMSEDCLSLNIWTKPQAGSAKKAVMIYLHGGSFTGGTSAQPIYSGRSFADAHDVVLVTLNYRLNVFGSPGIPSPGHSNLMLLDQRAAIEWVYDNIASFGGDRDRIVLFGESAGAGSADAHAYWRPDDHIVKGYILQSGTALGPGFQKTESAARTWFNITATLGCGSSANDDAAKVLECMQAKNASDIYLAGVKAVSGSSAGGLGESPYYPVIDNQIIFPDYPTRPSPAAPLLLGTTDKEFDLAKNWTTGAPPNPLLDLAAPILDDLVFNCPAAARAARANAGSRMVWRYRFFGQFPNTMLSTSPPSGAWHGSDVSVLFGTTPQVPVADTPEEVAVGRYMREVWTAFAKDPVNGLKEFGGGDTLMRFGFENRTGRDLVGLGQYDALCRVVNSSAGGFVMDIIRGLIAKLGQGAQSGGLAV